MTIQQRQQELIDEFADIDDWMDRYGYIIDMGNALPPIDEKLKTPDRLIEGCQSRVWLDAEFRDGKVYYVADSDAIIVKGMISMLVSVLSGHNPTRFLMPNSTSSTKSVWPNICRQHAATAFWPW